VKKLVYVSIFLLTILLSGCTEKSEPIKCGKGLILVEGVCKMEEQDDEEQVVEESELVLTKNQCKTNDKCNEWLDGFDDSQFNDDKAIEVIEAMFSYHEFNTNAKITKLLNDFANAAYSSDDGTVRQASIGLVPESSDYFIELYINRWNDLSTFSNENILNEYNLLATWTDDRNIEVIELIFNYGNNERYIEITLVSGEPIIVRNLE